MVGCTRRHEGAPHQPSDQAGRHDPSQRGQKQSGTLFSKIHPDQGHRLEIYYRDGRLERITNNVTTTNQTLFHRPTGARTNITYLPDGSRTEQVYSYGRLQSVTRKDSGGGQVTKTTYAYDAQGRMTNMVTWQFNLLTGAGSTSATTTWQYETNRGGLRLKGYPNARIERDAPFTSSL